jgi:hypothetical protein
MLLTDEIEITIKLVNTSISMLTVLLIMYVLQIGWETLSNLANVTKLISTHREGFDPESMALGS